MTIYADMRDAVYQGTVEVFNQIGLPTTTVIFSHQSGPEPSSPHCVIQIVIVDQVGRTEYSTLTDDATPTKHLQIKSTYEVQVQFTFGGSTAPELGHEFLNALRNNVVITEAFQKNNLAPMRKSSLRRAPQKREAEWIEFLNMDVTFSYAVMTTQDIDWVEHVTLKDANDGFTITVPPLPTP